MVVLDRFGGSSKSNAKATFRCNKVKTGPTVAPWPVIVVVVRMYRCGNVL
jgi:hypothetical protein